MANRQKMPVVYISLVVDWVGSGQLLMAGSMTIKPRTTLVDIRL